MPVSSRSRVGVATASLALHAALLAAVPLKPEPPPMRGVAGSVDVIAVTLAAAPPGPKATAAPEPAPDPPAPDLPGAKPGDAAAAEAAPLGVAEPPAAEAAETTGATVALADVAGCALSDRVLAALRAASPRAALARIPERRRSVAGAVMLWDGDWIRTGALADARVALPIRTAVAQAVEAAGPACAGAPVAGPVLLIVPDVAGATVLVVGSGTWRWADLATDAAPPHPTATGGR